MLDTDSRRTFRSKVSQRILAEFAPAGIGIASYTVTIVQFSSAPLQGQPTLAVGQLEEQAP